MKRNGNYKANEKLNGRRLKTMGLVWLEGSLIGTRILIFPEWKLVSMKCSTAFKACQPFRDLTFSPSPQYCFWFFTPTRKGTNLDSHQTPISFQLSLSLNCSHIHFFLISLSTLFSINSIAFQKFLPTP